MKPIYDQRTAAEFNKGITCKKRNIAQFLELVYILIRSKFRMPWKEYAALKFKAES